MSSGNKSTPKTHGRKVRSKSHDDADKTANKKTETKTKGSDKKVSRSKSHDDSIEKAYGKSRRPGGPKRHGSSSSAGGGGGGGGMMSLEDGLSKVAGPSLLQRKDFGRSADDDDTFCGTGTVDGEIERGKLQGIRKAKKPANPFGAASSSTAMMPKSDPFGSAFRSRGGGGGASDDSESDDEVDFFAGTSNPFKDLKKKAASKRTAL
uniref:Uncharacterized protein n=1 Tax=Amphora coffeiformis TaxID=265554 RepID=A0A7S3L172_9STRA